MPLQICLAKGFTCVHHQVLDFLRRGLNDEAKLLLQNSERIRDFAIISKKRFLHCAANSGDAPVNRYFFNNERKANAHDLLKMTPLKMVLNNFNVTCVAILLQDNADTYESAKTLQLIFRHCIHLFLNYGRQNYQPILEMIFDKLNADFSSRKKRERTLSLLNFNDSVRLAAVVFGNDELVKFILEEDYPIDFQEPTCGCTALHCAVMFAKMRNAKMLIDRGAKVNALDIFGYTPLHYYSDRCENADEQLEVLKCFVKNSTDPVDLENVILNGNRQTVRAVLQSGIDVDTYFKGGRYLLQLLVMHENPDVIELLEELDIKFDANARILNFGNTVLAIAVAKRCVKKVEFLLTHGAVVDDDAALDAVTMVFSKYPERPVTEAKITGLLLQHSNDTRIVDAKKWYLINALQRVKFRLATKVILAHLALLEVLKVSPLVHHTRSMIEHNRTFNAQYDLCLRQLENMKNVEVLDEISLFELLTQRNEDKMASYASKWEFVLAFDRTMENTPLEFYYFDVLQRRILKAVNKIELKRRAAAAFGKWTGLCTYMASAVINHLNYKDSRNVCLAENIAADIMSF